MEIGLDCIPCFLRQSLEATRMVTDDLSKQDEIIKESLNILLNYKSYPNAPALARDIHNVIKGVTGISDPYKETKERDLQNALAAYPVLKNFLSEKSNSIYWGLKAAATGNHIDAAINKNVDVEKCIEEELEKKFAICDLEKLEEKLSTAKEVLIIGDNTGESVFDRALIETLPCCNITYAVRSHPIINDVTEKEAIASGLGEVAKIISTGCNAPGAILDECSEEFLNVYNRTDVIISKGQGNFESLSEQKGNLFFLLKAKCGMIAKKLNVDINEYVFVLSNGD